MPPEYPCLFSVMWPLSGFFRSCWKLRRLRLALLLGLLWRPSVNVDAFHGLPQHDPAYRRSAYLLSEETVATTAHRDLDASNRSYSVSRPQRFSTVDPDDVNLRPNEGKDPEEISYGMYMKQFLGMDMKGGTFTADMVLFFQWVDSRAAAVVPSGSTSLTLPGDTAKNLVWMPGMRITNAASSTYVSSSVSVAQDGTVTKIDRVVAVVRQVYDLASFPFDEQRLELRVASGTYMSDEVVMVPLNDTSVVGIANGTFKMFDVHPLGIEALAIEDVDGMLHKSRGLFRVHVRRQGDVIVRSMILPAMLTTFLATSVFFMPLAGPYLMPRMSTSLFAVLGAMTLSTKTDALLPSHGGIGWMDIFGTDTQILIFSCMILNLFTIIVHGRPSCTDGAEKVNAEARLLMPTTAALTFMLLLCSTRPHNLDALNVVVMLVLFVALGGYLLRLILFSRTLWSSSGRMPESKQQAQAGQLQLQSPRMQPPMQPQSPRMQQLQAQAQLQAQLQAQGPDDFKVGDVVEMVIPSGHFAAGNWVRCKIQSAGQVPGTYTVLVLGTAEIVEAPASQLRYPVTSSARF